MTRHTHFKLPPTSQSILVERYILRKKLHLQIWHAISFGVNAMFLLALHTLAVLILNVSECP